MSNLLFIVLISVHLIMIAGITASAKPPPTGELEVGDVAPAFSLSSPDGSVVTDLDNFRGEMPVVLFFGSYT